MASPLQFWFQLQVIHLSLKESCQAEFASVKLNLLFSQLKFIVGSISSKEGFRAMLGVEV